MCILQQSTAQRVANTCEAFLDWFISILETSDMSTCCPHRWCMICCNPTHQFVPSPLIGASCDLTVLLVRVRANRGLRDRTYREQVVSARCGHGHRWGGGGGGVGTFL